MDGVRGTHGVYAGAVGEDFRLDLAEQCLWARKGSGPTRRISLTIGALRLLERVLQSEEDTGSKETRIDREGGRSVTKLPLAQQLGILSPLPSKFEKPQEPLTEREIKILRYLPSNLSASAIADELFVSVHTVKTHLCHIYGKLGVHRRSQAIRKARQMGLMPTDRPTICECGRVI